MENSRNKNNGNLSVNDKGKNIKKSSSHQSNIGTNASSSGDGARKQEPPRYEFYRTTVDEFKSLVQRLTGSPNHPPHKPLQNVSKPQTQGTRLQRIRPPPLSNVRPPVPVRVSAAPKAPPPHPPFNYNNNAIQLGGPSCQFTTKASSTNPLQLACSMSVTPQGEMSGTNVADQSLDSTSFQNSMVDMDSWFMDNLFDPQPQSLPYPANMQASRNPESQPQSFSYPSNVETQSQLYYYPKNVESQLQPYSYPSNVEPEPNLGPCRTQIPINFKAYPTSYGLVTTSNAIESHVSLNPSNSDQLVSVGLNSFPCPQTNDLSDLAEFLLPSPDGYMDIPMPLPSPPPQSPYRQQLLPDFQFPSSPASFPFTPYLGPDFEPPISPPTIFPMSPSGFSPMSSTALFPKSPKKTNQ